MADHLQLDEIADYLAGVVAADRAAAIEHHLGGCVGCVAQTAQVLEIVMAWDEWTGDFSSAGARQGLQVLLAARVDTPAADIEDLAARLRRWVRTGAEIVVSVSMPRLSQLPTYVIAGTEALVNADTRFAVAAASTGRVRGDNAGRELRGPFLEIPGEGRRRARILANIGERTTVMVQIDNYPADRRSPLVAVVAAGSGTVQLKLMTPLETAIASGALVDLEARFDLPDAVTEVQILVEPSEDR